MDNKSNEQPQPSAQTAMRRRLSHMIARAWTDEEFKNRLMTDPESVFTEYGIELPKGKLVVVENTSDVTHFVLPPKPASIAHLALNQRAISFCFSSHCGHAACDCSFCCDCGATGCGVCEICC